MEIFSALLAICAGNSPVPGEFPAQRPVTRSFDVFFDLHRINGWVNNGEAGDLRSYRAHYNVIVINLKASGQFTDHHRTLVTSHASECHGVSNLPQLDCLFSRFQRPRNWLFVRGIHRIHPINGSVTGKEFPRDSS